MVIPQCSSPSRAAPSFILSQRHFFFRKPRGKLWRKSKLILKAAPNNESNNRFMKASISQVLVILFCLAASARAAEPAIIPAPQEMKMQDGVFTLNANTQILAGGPDRQTAMLLAEKLRRGTGLMLPIRSAARPSTGGILLTTKDADPSLGAEGYELTVTPDSVVIRAATEAGLFYGAISLMQL